MSAGCSQSPGRDTACMLPRAAKSGLGTGDCDWRGLDRAGCYPEASGADPGCHAVKCLRRRLAASATWQLVPRQSLGLACSPPSPRPASPRRVERARGGADWARAEPNFASNGCDDAFNSLRAGTAHLPAGGGVRGHPRSLLSSTPLSPTVSSGLAGSDGFVQREDRFRVLAFALG